MKSQTEDRRIRRTKKLLKQSLLELMHTKKVKDITIKDITEKSDLNRGTFYLHYRDIYDLLSSIEDEVIMNFDVLLTQFKQLNGKQTPYELLEHLFVYIYENKELFILLLQSNADSKLLEKVQLLVKTSGLDTVRYYYKDLNSDYYEFFLSFVCSGILGVTQHWFERGMDIPPQQMATLVDKLVNDGVALLSDQEE